MSGQPLARWQDQTLILQVYLQPRASRDELVGWHERGLKIRLTAPPVDGAANKHLLKFLAAQFKVPVSNIHLLQGETSRQKTLSIHKPTRLPELLSIIEP